MPRVSHSEVFRYVVVIPAAAETWRASDPQLRGLITWGDARGISRSVGPRPFVGVNGSRVTLRAASRAYAAVASVSFELDAELFELLRPGDTVYMARSRQAGIGVSVFRDERLLLAAGAASLVRLTCGPHGGIDLATIGDAVAVAHGGRKLILEAGQRAWLHPYSIGVVRGLRWIWPWHDEVVAVEDSELVPDQLALRSAHLLARPNAGLTSEPWETAGPNEPRWGNALEPVPAHAVATFPSGEEAS